MRCMDLSISVEERKGRKRRALLLLKKQRKRHQQDRQVVSSEQLLLPLDLRLKNLKLSQLLLLLRHKSDEVQETNQGLNLTIFLFKFNFEVLNKSSIHFY